LDSDRVLSSPNELYLDFVTSGEHRGLVENLWGKIPLNLMESHKLAAEARSNYGATADVLEELKRGVKLQMRKWGILTSKVREQIDRMEAGVVEAGQQPMCLGGPGYIFNKVACAWTICNSAEGFEFVPLYYVADYDGIQNELLNIRVPSPSPRGLVISLPAKEELFGTPISELSNPSEAWLKQTVDKIRSNYKGLLKGVNEYERESKLQNLDHALTIIRNTYYSSENVSEWSTKTLGSLFNVEADLGVPIIAFSTPYTRHLFQPGYELLLSEPNRSRFIDGSNRAAEILEEAGFLPQIGTREDDYVPFFLECTNDACNRRRIELKYHRRLGASTANVAGRCPSCGETYNFSFSASNPDISEIVDRISPRVDTRQIIVDSVIPVICHVGGPGETSYYAEVAPAARKLNVPFPIIVRYTRTFYNTPWNESYSEILKKEGIPTLMSEKLFSALRRWVNARNSRDFQMLVEAHSKIRMSIESTFNNLLDRSITLEKEVQQIKKRLRDPENRRTLIKEMQEKQKLLHAINLYLSSAFGRFSPERYGQEVSWLWLDLATTSGVVDLSGVFLRQYNEQTPTSSMFFVNL
jgi:uncharacterized protein YllA (UPF0747 family)